MPGRRRAAVPCRHVFVTLIDGAVTYRPLFEQKANTVQDRGEHLSMSERPSIDYMCAHCGASSTYQLVPDAARGTHEPVSIGPSVVSIDFSCSRCGTIQTYMLVPDRLGDQAE